MNNLLVSVNKKTRTVISPKTYIGVEGENLQELIIFKFEDEFVDGTARLETQIGEDKNFINMDKVDETYTLPIRNVLTINGVIEMQLVITQDSDTNSIPVFKSEIFKLYCKQSIGATKAAPDGYELWIDTANRKLAEMDRVNIVAESSNNILHVEITDREGKKTIANLKEGKDGRDGTNGRDGVIQYYAGTGITISPNHVISADGEKYFAGDNITITDTNVINAIIDLTNYYNKSQIDTMIGDLQSITLEIVQTLPASGNTGTIYLVPVYIPETDPPELDYYTQHIYTNNTWQEIGTTRVDLTNYYTKVEVDNLLDEKQDKLEEVTEPIAPITDSTIFSSVDLTNKQVSKITASTLKNYIGRVSTNLQWETLPPITTDNLGSIVQYIGEDTPTRKKGFWYQAVREFSWYAWVDPVTSTNVYTANREPGIGDNLHQLEGGVIVETDLVVTRVDEYNIYDQNNTRYTRNSSSDRDMTYKWEILNDNLSEYINDEGYLKEDSVTGAISTGVSNDFTGNRVVVTTPLGKLTWSEITHEVLNYLSGVTSNIQTQLNGKQTALFESPELVNFTDTVPLSSVSVDGNTVTPVKGLTIWNYIKNKITSTWATNFLDKVYPVGAIYISTSSSSPATLFGGTWERIQDRFLLGAGSTYSAGTTGGSATKTIARSNLPNTTITTSSKGKKEFDLSGVKGFAYKGGGLDNKWGLDYGRKELYEKKSYTSTEETASDHTHSFNLNGNVTQTALNIMPPYLTVYMWRRTA